MFIPLVYSLILSLGGLPPALHVPHDVVNSVAVAPHAGGGLEIVIVADIDAKTWQVLKSTNGGRTWQILSGEGLELANPRSVVYHPEFPADTGNGLFLIGARKGIWAYHPGSGRVEAFATGLASEDLAIAKLAAPMAGSDGPAAAITFRGKVYLRSPGAPAWVLALDSGLGVKAKRVSVAVEPHFQSAAGPGPARALAASVNQRLFFSKDGGTHWMVLRQFNDPVDRTNGFLISALAFAEDFQTSGAFALAGADSNPPLGRIWYTTAFSKTLRLGFSGQDEIIALVASPLSPAGARCYFAAPRRIPWRDGPRTGILRSTDAGRSWSDFDNPQDFVIRDGSEVALYDRGVGQSSNLVVSPFFSVDGWVFNARDQSLVRSTDAGLHWRFIRTRPESDVRAMSATRNTAGEPLLFSATYGSGTRRDNLSSSECELLIADDERTDLYQKPVAASKHYPADGTVFVGAWPRLVAWFDPLVAPLNPFGATGWHALPLYNAGMPIDEGYPRSIAVSPHFSSHGGVGLDQCLYWCANVAGERGAPFRSRDGGVTAEQVPALAGGGSAPFMSHIEVAPTYDDAVQSGRSDVYGTGKDDGGLYRLTADTWNALSGFGGRANCLALDPGYARPDNPHLFVGTEAPAQVVEIWDHPGGPTIRIHTAGLGAVRITGIALAVDFAYDPVVYVATLASGVFKMDLSAPSPAFQPLNDGFPGVWVKSIAVSPDHPADRRVLAGTAEGVFVITDVPGGSWQARPARFFRDNRFSGLSPAIHPFAPDDPTNPNPDRTWNWPGAQAGALPFQVNVCGPNIHYTRYDGSYLVCEELARSVRLHTLAGAGMGVVDLHAMDPAGTPLASVSVDLESLSTVVVNHEVELDLGAMQAIEVRVDVSLAPGELFFFDGFEFVR